MGARAELHICGFSELVTENLAATRADKSVVGSGIHDENQIGEAVDEAAREFLFLVELALHLAASGNIHQGTLIADHAAGGVANDAGRVEAVDGRAILAQQSDFAALRRRLALDFLDKRFSRGMVREDFRDALGEQFFLGVVLQHADERGIDVEDGAVGKSDIDAFLERLEELGKTRFIFAKGGDVSAENGKAMDFVVARHGVRDAIVIADSVLLLEADLNDAGPVAALDKTRHGAADQFGAVAAALFEKLGNLAADNLLVVGADEIRKAAIHGTDFTLKRERNENVIEGIDEVAIALLGTGDDGEELIDLLFARGSGIPLLQAGDQAAQLGDFAVAFPGVGDEQSDDEKQKRQKRFVAQRESFYGAPGDEGKADGEHEKQKKSEAP